MWQAGHARLPELHSCALSPPLIDRRTAHERSAKASAAEVGCEGGEAGFCKLYMWHAQRIASEEMLFMEGASFYGRSGLVRGRRRIWGASEERKKWKMYLDLEEKMRTRACCVFMFLKMSFKSYRRKSRKMDVMRWDCKRKLEEKEHWSETCEY